MEFDPGLQIGQTLKNNELVAIFKCGNMGGMRRSKTTNTLVLISDYTKGLYHDKWIGGVLHYTGTGKTGDQDIHWAQNATLADCGHNGVDVHLFEVMDAGEYVYCGRVALVDEPYVAIQPGEDGNNRKVWMFPIRPVPENNVKKPPMFVFRDMEDYKARGATADAEYRKKVEEKKRRGSKPKTAPAAPTTPPRPPKPMMVAPPELIGKKVKHKSYGEGTVTAISGVVLTVLFSTVGEKKLSYEACIKNKLIELI